MRILRHVFSSLSIIFAFPTLAVIILCSNRVSVRYAVNLSMMVSQENIMVIILLMLDPVMFLPDTCIIREHPIIPIPGAAISYYVIWVAAMTLTVPPFFACFLERHQAVQRPGSRWLLPMGLRHCFIGTSVVIVLSLPGILLFSEMPFDEEQMLLETVRRRWTIISMMRANCIDHSIFLLFSSVSVGCLVLGVFVTILISWHTFSTIMHNSILSETMKRSNRAMTKALLMQSIVPLVFVLFPLMFSLVAVIANVDGPIPFSLCYLFISIYALAHSLILIAVTPMYRIKLLEMLNRITKQEVNNIHIFERTVITSLN